MWPSDWFAISDTLTSLETHLTECPPIAQTLAVGPSQPAALDTGSRVLREEMPCVKDTVTLHATTTALPRPIKRQPYLLLYLVSLSRRRWGFMV